MFRKLEQFLNFYRKRVTSNYKIEEAGILDSICELNRNTLKNIKEWFPYEVSRKSYFQYGVPDDIRDLLDLDIGRELTYTDLMSYYARLLEKVNYLELGVSVGKNFLQLCNQFKNASLTGFDIENINPVLEKHFENMSIENWSTPTRSLRKEESTLKRYIYQNNHIEYIAGDIWDEYSWERLSGRKFNLIFSDALHEHDALLWEFKMLEKYDLIDANFMIFWDDLNHGLETAFFSIAKHCAANYGLKKENVHLVKINGWLGQNYPIKHDLGFISNIDLY